MKVSAMEKTLEQFKKLFMIFITLEAYQKLEETLIDNILKCHFRRVSIYTVNYDGDI